MAPFEIAVVSNTPLTPLKDLDEWGAAKVAWDVGVVMKEANRKAVEILPLAITFEGDTLAVR